MADLTVALGDDTLDALADALAPRLAHRLAAILREQSQSQDGWLDSRQAADYLRVSVSTIHRLTASRSIAFEQSSPGGRVFFKRSSLDAWRAR